MTVLPLVKCYTKYARCHCKLLTVYIIRTGTQTIYKYVYFRCAQPAKHHARAPYLRHQQSSLLRLWLACSVLRTDGHNGCDLRTDRAAVAQKGTIRGRASRIWPVSAPGWKVRCFQDTPAPSQPSQIIHDITPALQNQRLLWQVQHGISD